MSILATWILCRKGNVYMNSLCCQILVIDTPSKRQHVPVGGSSSTFNVSTDHINHNILASTHDLVTGGSHFPQSSSSKVVNNFRARDGRQQPGRTSFRSTQRDKGSVHGMGIVQNHGNLGSVDGQLVRVTSDSINTDHMVVRGSQSVVNVLDIQGSSSFDNINLSYVDPMSKRQYVVKSSGGRGSGALLMTTCLEVISSYLVILYFVRTLLCTNAKRNIDSMERIVVNTPSKRQHLPVGGSSSTSNISTDHINQNILTSTHNLVTGGTAFPESSCFKLPDNLLCFDLNRETTDRTTFVTQYM